MAQLSVAGEMDLDLVDYYEIDGMLTELKRQLRQREGYPFSPLALKAHLQKAIEGEFEGARLKPALIHDKRKSGWKPARHVPRQIGPGAGLEHISLLSSGEEYLKGSEVAIRAVSLRANLGQEDAEYLLGNQAMIPRGLEKCVLLFPGTLWRVSDQRLMSCLVFDGAQWVLEFMPLSRSFRSSCRLIRLK